MSALARSALRGIPQALSLPPPNLQYDSPRLVDLCRTIQVSRPSTQLKDGYGYIWDETSTNSWRYQLFPTNVSKEDNDTISLGNVLNDTSGTLAHLSLETKFYLALVLASSFLQLSETGWLPKILTHDDVFFVKRNGTIAYREVFITKPLVEQPQPALVNPAGPAMLYNASLFSLGVLLIEIMLVTSFTDLKASSALHSGLESNHVSDYIRDHRVAMSLLERVKSAGDDAYKNAVRRCIDNEYGSKSLEDDSVQQFLYAGVVSLLEEGLKVLEMPMHCDLFT